MADATRALLDAIAALRREHRKDTKYSDLLDQLDDVEESAEKLAPADQDTKPDEADKEESSKDEDDSPTNLKDASDRARTVFRKKREQDAKQPDNKS